MSLELAVDKAILYRDRPDVMSAELWPDPADRDDEWQRQVLADFPHRPMQALLACKGPGKTCTLAKLAWNFLLTRIHPKVGAVSITGGNLKTNLWPEMAKWQKKSPLLTSLFEWSSEKIYLREHPETWFMAAKNWSHSASEEELGATLAGLWARHVLFLLDEAGSMPVPILRTAQAALQREGTEGHIVMAGNTNSTTGCLYEAAVRRRHLWQVYSITADPDDPNRTPRISMEYARAQIAEYGRDDPWVMVNILAKFPSQGLNQLISPEEVVAAQGRHLHPHIYEWAPKILGGDVARFGDDKSIAFPRQGLLYTDPIVLGKLDSVQVAGHFGQKASEWGADSIQIDATGGYGAGVIDVMRSLSYIVQEVEFSGKPLDAKFYNKRAEIWWKLVENIKAGASLPRIERMVPELSTATYSFKGDQILIEPKELMKVRLGFSPDYTDAAACTHAFPVAAPDRTSRALFPFDISGQVSKSRADYDPLQRD